MRASTFICLGAALISTSSAHTVFTTLFINEENQGDGTCVRMPQDPSTCTYPIASIESQDMACGVDGETAVAFTCPAPAGANLTFEFREWADASNPGSIDPSHRGPCAVYLKAVTDMANDTAAGDGWFKIWHAGYDEDAQQWCTETLIENNGLLSVSLPTGIPSGYYLVRPELLALQDAESGDPQFYVGCAQLFVQGGESDGLDVPAQYQASIPGYLQPSNEAVTFDIWQSPMALPYPIPGPAPYFPTVSAAAGANMTQTHGVIPTNCLIKVANWCGFEVASYIDDQAGCWNASANCFQQQAACYDSAPPTGGKGCGTWGTKCAAIQAGCNAGDFTGPPNEGQTLQDPSAPVPGQIPAAAAAASGTLKAL